MNRMKWAWMLILVMLVLTYGCPSQPTKNRVVFLEPEVFEAPSLVQVEYGSNGSQVRMSNVKVATKDPLRSVWLSFKYETKADRLVMLLSVTGVSDGDLYVESGGLGWRQDVYWLSVDQYRVGLVELTIERLNWICQFGADGAIKSEFDLTPFRFSNENREDVCEFGRAIAKVRSGYYGEAGYR